MFAPWIALSRKAISALVANGAPTQLAAGFTIGMIVGLMPKGNLIALSLCVLLFSLRVNKGLSLIAIVLFTWIGPACDPLAHKLGASVLGSQSLQTCYAAVFNLPLGPWLGFENTVVTGSLLLGLYIAYPVYWLSRVICERLFVAKDLQLQGDAC